MQRSIVIDWLLHIQFRIKSLVFVEPDHATNAEDSDQTKENVSEIGRGGAVHWGVAVQGLIFIVIDRLVFVVIY